MTFSCKITLSEYQKQDGSLMVYIQAIIDRKKATVPLGFYLKKEFFDQRRQLVKSSHANAETYNTEISMALTSANLIASRCRIEKRALTADIFRKSFTNHADEVDFIRFVKQELTLNAPGLAENTIKQHNTVINKLLVFRKVIPFNQVTPQLMQEFKNYLGKSLGNPTVNKILKIVKYYLSESKKRGHTFEDPFVSIKIKSFLSNRLALTELELKRLEDYYNKSDCQRSHKKLLRYFLFCCYTGLRISDIGKITWNNIHDDLLIYIPEKTKRKGETITIPITREREFLPPFKTGGQPIFETYTDQFSNRHLKKIAISAGIKKEISFHTSRHTFGTLMAESGHLSETQKMMGHSDIKTTMGYIHTSNKNLIDAKKKRFGFSNEIEASNLISK